MKVLAPGTLGDGAQLTASWRWWMQSDKCIQWI